VGVFEAPRVQLATGLPSTKKDRPLADGTTNITPPQAFPPVSSRAGRPTGRWVTRNGRTAISRTPVLPEAMPF